MSEYAAFPYIRIYLKARFYRSQYCVLQGIKIRVNELPMLRNKNKQEHGWFDKQSNNNKGGARKKYICLGVRRRPVGCLAKCL